MTDNQPIIPIFQLAPGELEETDILNESEKAWAKTNKFDGEEEKTVLLPNADGHLSKVLFGLGKAPSPLSVGKLARDLPTGNYAFQENRLDAYLTQLGWHMGAYKFTRYNNSEAPQASLTGNLPDNSKLQNEVDAITLARDLINTPANDMGPDALEAAIQELAKTHGAEINVIKGDALLTENFPMIHAVGRAAEAAPRLVDLQWGSTDHPKVTLVGKGVVFDTGGLNLKPGNSMALMKKDMGGAANTIALAQFIMAEKLPVRLRLLVPIVENAVSGNAFRPGDILSSRKGITVEIGNTDAEGRLILADALALGDEEAPEIMLDMATLTGAARVALGPDLPPFYVQDDAFAGALSEASAAVLDPLWRMPLWPPYRKMLESKIADINHISSGGFAGSVTAALFLEKFVEKANIWAHFDIYGWVPNAKSWAPMGGEAQGIRAIFNVLENRFPKS